MYKRNSRSLKGGNFLLPLASLIPIVGVVATKRKQWGKIEEAPRRKPSSRQKPQKVFVRQSPLRLSPGDIG